MCIYTCAERVVAGIFWDGCGDINTFVEMFCILHIKDIKHLLNTEHLRIPANTPEEAYTKRSKKPKSLKSVDILDSYPGSYIAPEWRGFAYTQHAYRDWHFVTHSMCLKKFVELNTWIIPNNKTYTDPKMGIQWMYVVDACGHTRHIHGLVSFVFAHKMNIVRNMLKLPDDTLLEPIWGSFNKAVEYLKKQEIKTLEIGTKPTRNIWIDGNLVDIPRQDMLKAISTGENIEELEYPYKKDVDPALDEWCYNIKMLKNKNWTQNIIKAKTNKEAEIFAKRTADRYTCKYFVIDYNQILPGGIFTKRPREWFGEEVVLFLNIPKEYVKRQLKASWLSSIPEIVYTVKGNKKRIKS